MDSFHAFGRVLVLEIGETDSSLIEVFGVHSDTVRIGHRFAVQEFFRLGKEGELPYSPCLREKGPAFIKQSSHPVTVGLQVVGFLLGDETSPHLSNDLK